MAPLEDEIDELIERAEILTVELRDHPGRRYEDLRSKLSDEGIEILDAVLATVFPNDTTQIYGVVVARDGRAFSFTWESGRDADGRAIEDPRDEWVSEWSEIGPDVWPTFVRVGRVVLDREN